MNQNPEIQYLLAQIEGKYGRKVNTTSDFEALSIIIEHEVGDILSASTLKRLWGYVNDSHTPRISTLDILCRYIGFRNFVLFRESLKEISEFNSGFLTSSCVESSTLEVGTRIEIGWNPNRYVILQYLGNQLFRVEKSLNSKLESGDEFEVSTIMIGYPLYIAKIKRNNEFTRPFIAGQNNGLTLLNIL